MTEREFLIEADANDHRPLLWLALELTGASEFPVGEFGSGMDSTNYLRHYCQKRERVFYSYDNHKEWGERWGSEYVTDWLNPDLYKRSSVVLVDQGPAEDRHQSIFMLKELADIIIVHDVEPWNAVSYQLYKIWNLFKYRVFLKGENIWTAALSNKFDLTKYNNHLVGQFKLEI